MDHISTDDAVHPRQAHLLHVPDTRPLGGYPSACSGARAENR